MKSVRRRASRLTKRLKSYKQVTLKNRIRFFSPVEECPDWREPPALLRTVFLFKDYPIILKEGFDFISLFLFPSRISWDKRFSTSLTISLFIGLAPYWALLTSLLRKEGTESSKSRKISTFLTRSESSERSFLQIFFSASPLRRLKTIISSARFKNSGLKDFLSAFFASLEISASLLKSFAAGVFRSRGHRLSYWRTH